MSSRNVLSEIDLMLSQVNIELSSVSVKMSSVPVKSRPKFLPRIGIMLSTLESLVSSSTSSSSESSSALSWDPDHDFYVYSEEDDPVNDINEDYSVFDYSTCGEECVTDSSGCGEECFIDSPD